MITVDLAYTPVKTLGVTMHSVRHQLSLQGLSSPRPSIILGYGKT
jgi:hypothetical protein